MATIFKQPKPTSGVPSGVPLGSPNGTTVILSSQSTSVQPTSVQQTPAKVLSQPVKHKKLNWNKTVTMEKPANFAKRGAQFAFRSICNWMDKNPENMSFNLPSLNNPLGLSDKTTSIAFTDVLRLFFMITFALIIINAVLKVKILKIKRDYNLGSDRNPINKIELLDILYRELWYVPFIIWIYWFIFVAIMDMVLFFVGYLIVSNSGGGMPGVGGVAGINYQTPLPGKINEHTTRDNKESLRNVLSVKMGTDLKILGSMMIFNLLILIPYIWIHTVLFSKQSQINIDKIGKIYKYATIMSLMTISLYFNYSKADTDKANRIKKMKVPTLNKKN
jgi:hypothetical protein